MVRLELVTHPTSDARLLIGELEAEMASIYSAEQRHGLSIERVFQPNIAFFLAYLDATPAGCGGIAFDDGFAELKRMYVRPSLRGRGIVQAMLERLESEAHRRDYCRIALETGDAQHAAIRAYERAGYSRCAVFGGYLALTPQAIVRSVFLEKVLRT